MIKAPTSTSKSPPLTTRAVTNVFVVLDLLTWSADIDMCKEGEKVVSDAGLQALA